jgi:hypothetical protein
MKFTIELKIGLLPLQAALPQLVTDRETKTHRRGRSKRSYGHCQRRTEIPEAEPLRALRLHAGAFRRRPRLRVSHRTRPVVCRGDRASTGTSAAPASWRKQPSHAASRRSRSGREAGATARLPAAGGPVASEGDMLTAISPGAGLSRYGARTARNRSLRGCEIRSSRRRWRERTTRQSGFSHDDRTVVRASSRRSSPPSLTRSKTRRCTGASTARARRLSREALNTRGARVGGRRSRRPGARPRPGEALAGAQQMVGPNDRALLPSSSSATWAAESAVAL